MPAVIAPRQPSGTAFALRDPLPWNDLAAIVRASETAGYAVLFLPEISGRDAIVTLGALAGETRDLLLGTGVVPMASRTPMLTAMAAATVQERSGGRLILGVGTGGVTGGALERLRAYVESLRRLLEGETVEVDGRGRRLALVPDGRVPIWISALGPKAMRLAGEVADGVILNWCPPERVAFAAERVREGAEPAGRDPAEVAISVYVRSWVGDDEAEAWPALARDTAQYASYPAYARQFEQVGLGEEAAEAARALLAGRPEEVPESLVRAACAIGEGAAIRMEAYREAGADLPVVYPVATSAGAASIESTLSALAPA
jgi:alkanesulfonate monooxygenase SsuD/methylene tetrahydromethanopterin reductase-like flavin-dependent oxidoreductase (luciferase family)